MRNWIKISKSGEIINKYDEINSTMARLYIY